VQKTVILCLLAVFIAASFCFGYSQQPILSDSTDTARRLASWEGDTGSEGALGGDAYVIWYEGSTRRIFHYDELSNRGRVFNPSMPEADRIELRAARNEYEPFQLVITPRMNTPVEITVSALTGPGTISAENMTVNPISYVNVVMDRGLNTGWGRLTPDYLEPDADFMADGLHNNPVWITVYVPPKTPPGEYNGEIRITLKPYFLDEPRVERIPVNLTVWDFELPKFSYLNTMHDIDLTVLRFVSQYDKRPEEEIFTEYLDNLKRHRVRLIYIYPPLPEASWDGETVTVDLVGWTDKAEYYMKEYGYRTFCLPLILASWRGPRYWSDFLGLEPLSAEFKLAFSDYCRQIGRLFKEKGWYEKIYFDLWEETDRRDYDRCMELFRLVKEADPDLRIMWGKGQGERSRVPGGLVDMWNARDIDADKVTELKAVGENVKDNSVVQTRITGPATVNRGYMWGIKRDGIDNSAIYALAFWFPETGGRWELDRELGLLAPPVPIINLANSATVDPSFYPVSNGSGMVFYPNPADSGPPVNSIRWELIREGVEDYDYLSILAERIDRVKRKLKVKWDYSGGFRAREIAARVVPDRRLVIDDPEIIYRTRDNVAKEILTVGSSPLILVKTEPWDNSTVDANGGEVVVRGAVESGTTVKVNGEEVRVRQNTFETGVGLRGRKGRPLENEIIIEAVRENNTKKLVRRITVEYN
jgi:hypothetical protein